MTELVLSSGERAVLACPFLAYFRAEWELAQLLDLIESMGGPEVDNQFFQDIIFTFGNDPVVGPIIIEVGACLIELFDKGKTLGDIVDTTCQTDDSLEALAFSNFWCILVDWVGRYMEEGV